MNKRKRDRINKIIEYLYRDGRAPIIQIARDLNIPKSTVFDYIRELKNKFVFTIIEKEKFEKFLKPENRIL